MRSALGLAALAAVFATPGAAWTEGDPPSLLLVTIDTLRADRLGAYGHGAAETPTTDRLAREGVLVEDATSHVPQTAPSHASIFTGRLPPEHGVRDNFSPPLRTDLPTLAEALGQQGWETAAFVGALPVSARSGLDRGFGYYDDPFSKPGGHQLLSRSSERRADAVVDAALEWLARPRTRPFFAWVHLYDPHEPYDPPAPFATRHRESPYDGEVAYADAQLGRLVDHLDAAGRRRSTLLVVTADHGEGLGDHGEDEHLIFVYDSTLHVPLILSWPGSLPQEVRVSGQFRQVDLMATLLELVGARPVATSGVSRAAELRSGAHLPDSESYAESLYGQVHFGHAPLRALRVEGWKYIDAPRGELYALRDDPGEERNLIDQHAPVADRMSAALARYDAAGGAPAPTLAADAGLMERLATLGYVGGGASRSGTAAGADPKDQIEEYQSYKRDTREATRLMKEGDVDRALPLLQRLARADTMSFESEYLLGRALVLKGRHAEAVAPLETALELLPSHVASYLELARAYAGSGRDDDAMALLARGLEADPQSALLHETRGLLLLERGRAAEARAALERARDLAPRNFQVRLALSAAQRDAGDVAAATAELQEAVRRGPRFALGWNALGVLLRESGRDAEALAAFEKALGLIPRDPDVLFNTAEARARAGDVVGARSLLENLIARAPGYPGAAEALAAVDGGTEGPAAPSILVRVLAAATRDSARDLAARLAAGERGDAARDLGLLRIEDLAVALQDAARALPPGGVSVVLESPGGFFVLYREP